MPSDFKAPKQTAPKQTAPKQTAPDQQAPDQQAPVQQARSQQTGIQSEEAVTCQVSLELGGERLDQIAAKLFPDFSRARLQEWIKQGFLRVDGQMAKPKQKLHGGEQLDLVPQLEPQGEWLAENIPLNTVFEDDHIMVINKSVGAVVHPAAGNASGTILNALLHHDKGLANLPRAGIVHRLDKDTSGLMVVAKTLQAHNDLVSQLQARTVSRQYLAVVVGIVPSNGRVEAAIGRHPSNRKKMAVVKNGGKTAVTHYAIENRFQAHSLLRLKLETGRTHQIRVHMQHIGYPLVGDPVYGGRQRKIKTLPDDVSNATQNFSRQALHATQLGLVHPVTGENAQWQCDPPKDMMDLIGILKGNSTDINSEGAALKGDQHD